MSKDPLPRLINYMIDNSILNKEELNEIDSQINDEIKEAIKFAEESPWPPIESVVEDIYTDIVEEVKK